MLSFFQDCVSFTVKSHVNILEHTQKKKERDLGVEVAKDYEVIESSCSHLIHVK